MARPSAVKAEPSPTPRAPAGVVDVTTLPVILTAREISSIYRLSEYTILKAVRAGTFLRPWAKHPYRWHREDVLADLELRRRPLKASLPQNKQAR